MSATQSFTSALRLKLGWISSMAPPKALAPMKTGSRPKRPVRAKREGERGEGDEVHELVAALRRRGRRLQGPEHRELRVSVTARVRGMSRYLRMQPA